VLDSPIRGCELVNWLTNAGITLLTLTKASANQDSASFATNATKL
jgi:hypothetical protein